MESNFPRCIDLHIHSTASDGTLSPAEILTLAQEINLSAVAITDHDTVSGVQAALALKRPPGLAFLTGVEISTAPPDEYALGGSLHILGYGMRLDHPELQKILHALQAARVRRNPDILQRLAELGLPVTPEEAARAAGAGNIGRPHIAKVLVQKGLARSINEAFNRWLGQGKPAYVNRLRAGCREVIEALHQAGGLAVLAHPALISLDRNQLHGLVQNLRAMGLDGIEVYYSAHKPAQIQDFLALADRLGLLITGGTDFHGAITPEIHLGTGYGDLAVPYQLYEKICEKLT